jgi:pimeloyl-ACP methyl ester carboxylesterase
LLRELDTGPVIAVGDSMGGAIAQYLWRQHPDLVSGLPGAGRLQ